MDKHKHVRVLYSFPHKLGADRICYTAWQQVNGLAAAGAELLVYPGVLYRPVRANVQVIPTLSWRKMRVSYKLLGRMRACALHDYIVAKRIEKLAGKIDIIHTWPLGAIHTLRTAEKLGIPTVLERPNTHTRYGYQIVNEECDRLGVRLQPGDDHVFREYVLSREEEEYRRAYRILCPSNFVKKTFIDQGFTSEKLVRHVYGFDESRFYPDVSKEKANELKMLFVGTCLVVKGLHYALEAWLKSPAHEAGTFKIVGKFDPNYAEKLSVMLAHPSVEVLGQRSDVPDLMRCSDVLVLPSITEGFGLVCAEAIGSGCVPLVSEACTDICKHMENALVHRVGDVKTLTQHITMLHEDRALLERLRARGLSLVPDITWTAAGRKLLQVYREIIESRK